MQSIENILKDTIAKSQNFTCANKDTQIKEMGDYKCNLFKSDPSGKFDNMGYELVYIASNKPNKRKMVVLCKLCAIIKAKKAPLVVDNKTDIRYGSNIVEGYSNSRRTHFLLKGINEDDITIDKVENIKERIKQLQIKNTEYLKISKIIGTEINKIKKFCRTKKKNIYDFADCTCEECEEGKEMGKKAVKVKVKLDI